MDYYKILGINKSASDEEIKKAYRKLAHQHHPDKTGGDDKKFKEINEAYQILSNKEKRAQYDRFGRVFSGQPAGGGFDFSGGPGFGGFSFDFGGEGFDSSNLGDFFDAFFEGLGVKQKRRTYRRGSDAKIAVELTLEEAFKGGKRNLVIESFVYCEKCGGKGHDPKAGFAKCVSCDGRGEIRETRSTFFGNFSQVKTCDKCRGIGQTPNKICRSCDGGGRVRGKRNIEINLFSGIDNGQIIKIVGGGEAGENNAGFGDLYAIVKISPHSVFTRKGDDLFVKKEADLLDILLGGEIDVPSVSGGRAVFEIPAGFNLKEPARIKGEGMPSARGGRGDLFVELEVKTPKRLSEKTRAILEELKKELRH